MEKELEIQAVISFKGDVNQGLILHPDNEHLIFPFGSTIIVRHILTRTQSFLRGHDNAISVIKCSPSGKFIASGQVTYMGFQADIIVWNFSEKSLLYRFKLHKVLIQSLTFSHNEKYLASLGGIDDKNTMVVWDMDTGKALYGSPVGTNGVEEIHFFNKSDDKLLAVLSKGLQILTIDKAQKKIRSISCNFGNLKRNFTCGIIDTNDQFIYAGTTTGDVLEINVEQAIFKRLGPIKDLFQQGVSALGQLPNGDLIVGTGAGKISKLNIQNMIIKSEGDVLGAVTSISFTADFTHFFCGTKQSNIYWIDSEKLQPELRNTCHYQKINDVQFPYDVFATCSMNDIRVWNTKNRQELLRIQVPNIECNCIAFMNDGKSILSGWNDGKIRAFFPQSGKLMYVINDAHIHGVTAMSTTSDCSRIISGGNEGEVRIWKMGKQTQTMQASLKEHRGRVWAIQVRKNNDQAVSASSDGSCIVWDINNFTRIICLFESTLFKQVLYHPEESQLLTTGSDRKITYWATFDGSAIRMLEGSEDGEINALAITREGEHFVSGGEDKLLKLWGYDEGMCQYIGTGHSGAITRIAISPDQKSIISVGSEGAIFIWKMPEEVVAARAENELPTLAKEKNEIYQQQEEEEQQFKQKQQSANQSQAASSQKGSKKNKQKQ